MTKTMTKLTLGLALAAATILTVAAGPAAAHGGPGHGDRGLGAVSPTKLVNAAAKQLSVTPATLKAAILKSANTRIDAAVADGDITAAEASDLKDEAADNLNVAYRFSRATTVASNLSITVTKLNDAFRAARKALITAKIDAALAAGDIDADQAAELKSQLADLTLPGYQQTRGIGLGLGGGPGFGGHGFRR